MKTVTPVLALLCAVLMALHPEPARAVTITVNSTNDPAGFSTSITTNGLGATVTLRDAINAAKNSGATNLIVFDSSLAGTTFYLTNVQDTSVGPSAFFITASTLTIQGPTNGGITLDGRGVLRPIRIFSTAKVTLNDLTIAHGAGGNPGGGAIYNNNQLQMNRCTLTGNSATNNSGGALFNNVSGTSALFNCTIAGNIAAIWAGGIYNQNSNLTLVNVTISGNTNNTASGTTTAGLFSEPGSAATLTNTIITGNYRAGEATPKDVGGTASGWNNLIGVVFFATGLTNGVNGNMVGVANPGLAELADNGGPTRTMALLPTSPAINAGLAIAGLTTDQRGFARTVGSAPDIGALEDPTGNDDPDGDSLSNATEFLLGSNPLSIDSDGDGFNDATEMLAGTNPNSAASVPSSTHVERVLGYGPARGLDLSGNFVYAFNVGTPGAAGQAGDANFTADNAPGITVIAPQEIAVWTVRDFGNSAADDVIETVYRSIRWADIGNADPNLRNLRVDLANLVPGRKYKLQLLFAENGDYNRRFDVFVQGVQVADDFNISTAQGPFSTKSAAAIVHEFTATNATLHVVLDGANLAVPADQNPILNGVTLEDLSGLASTPFALSGATRKQDGSFSFGFTNVSGASLSVLCSTNLALPLNQWSNLGAPVETPAGSGNYQFTDLQATNRPQRFYRVSSP